MKVMRFWLLTLQSSALSSARNLMTIPHHVKYHSLEDDVIILDGINIYVQRACTTIEIVILGRMRKSQIYYIPTERNNVNKYIQSIQSNKQLVSIEMNLI